VWLTLGASDCIAIRKRVQGLLLDVMSSIPASSPEGSTLGRAPNNGLQGTGGGHPIGCSVTEAAGP
jgi:hypothetical protein